MKKRIFSSIMLVAVTVLLASLALIVGVLHEHFEVRVTEELGRATAYIAHAVENEGLAYLEEGLPGDDRVTWVAADGTVLFDNREKASAMANHADRAEIAAAMERGWGTATRRSDTLSQQTVYYALRLADGSVMRLAATQYSVWMLVLQALRPVILVVLLAVGLAMWLAGRLSRQLVRPINAIDLSDPRDEDTYEELSPLLSRIRSQNRQLQKQMEELRAQDAMRREFTANVSHELKTPLTSIVGTAEIMENGLVRPEDVPHFAGNIYREANRLIGLVNDIIKLSRLEEGSPTARWETVDLRQVVEAIRDQLSFAAARREVTLTLRGGSVMARGIPQVVEEVLYNLCDNAIAYNRTGGSVTVTVEDTPEGGRVTVTDTGIGIPREVQDRVFERFYQVDHSHGSGGTGLGLSIVKHGAAYLGARVELESEEGKGSTFTVLFPPVHE